LSGDIATGDSDGALSAVDDRYGISVLDLQEADSQHNPLK
jgi:hypothetical protein